MGQHIALVRDIQPSLTHPPKDTKTNYCYTAIYPTATTPDTIFITTVTITTTYNTTSTTATTTITTILHKTTLRHLQEIPKRPKHSSLMVHGQ